MEEFQAEAEAVAVVANTKVLEFMVVLAVVALEMVLEVLLQVVVELVLLAH